MAKSERSRSALLWTALRLMGVSNLAVAGALPDKFLPCMERRDELSAR